MVPGLRMASTFSEQSALDVEILDDGFDDPVDVGEFLEVVFEVADRDEAGERRVHEGGGFGFSGSFESGSGDFISCGTVGVGGNDIEQIAGNAGIGEMRGDAGAHGSGAEDGDFINSFHDQASDMKVFNHRGHGGHRGFEL